MLPLAKEITRAASLQRFLPKLFLHGVLRLIKEQREAVISKLKGGFSVPYQLDTKKNNL